MTSNLFDFCGATLACMGLAVGGISYNSYNQLSNLENKISLLEKNNPQESFGQKKSEVSKYQYQVASSAFLSIICFGAGAWMFYAAKKQKQSWEETSRKTRELLEEYSQEHGEP